MIFSRETGMESSNMESISEESMDSLVEAFIYDDISRRPDALREEAINSPEMEALLERGKFKKNTLVRLNRNDDLERRIELRKENYLKLLIRNIIIKLQELLRLLKLVLLSKNLKLVIYLQHKSQVNFNFYIFIHNPF